MSLLFAKSKYTFNNWKQVNVVKNYNRSKIIPVFSFKPRKIFLFSCIILYTFLSRHFTKKMINDNILINQRFENRKLKQISYDYMIYTISTKDQFNDINKLSLF